MKINAFRLIGIALDSKTTNLNDQSSCDCGKLWQKFEQGGYLKRIPQRLNDNIYAVYHNYSGDQQDHFEYFIGCIVNMDTIPANGMKYLDIPDQNYEIVSAVGKIPDCIKHAWYRIWESGIERAYQFDFEVYDERSKNWADGLVTINVSIQ